MKYFKLLIVLMSSSLLFFSSCSSDDNSNTGTTIPYGNADQLPGTWQITQKYLALLAEKGDTLHDQTIADIRKPMNAMFESWIDNGGFKVTYGTLSTSESSGLKWSTFDEESEKSFGGNFYIQSDNETITIEYESWDYETSPYPTAKVGVSGSSFYMMQTLSAKDIENLWKFYGGGNRTFFEDDQLTLITKATRVE